MHKLMHINDVLFLLTIPKQDQELSPCSCSGLSLPGRGHVLVRCSHTVTGLRTLFLFLPFLDLLWNSLIPFTPYRRTHGSRPLRPELSCSFNILIVLINSHHGCATIKRSMTLTRISLPMWSQRGLKLRQ